MSAVVKQPTRYHTDVLSSGEDRFRAGPWTSSFAEVPNQGDLMVLTFAPVGDHYIVSGGTLAQCIMLGGSFRMPYEAVTSSKPSLLVRGSREPVARELAEIGTPSQTAAQAAVERIRAISGLTNEEIAPLAGVSRRSIQAWVAGESISARKEQRLRAALDAIRELAASDPSTTRQRLFDRAHAGDVRPYDLMVEGRFREAADYALARRSTTSVPAAPQAHDLLAQLSHMEGRVEMPPARLDKRFSGRLRR